MAPPAEQPAPPNPRPPRRRRYAGTHPRRFAERYKELDPQAHPDLVEHVRARGRTPAGSHVPIMVAEVLSALCVGPGQVVADCTLGHGGHAEVFLGRIGQGGKLIGLDVDERQLQRTADRLRAAAHDITVRHSNFAALAKVMAELGIAGCNVIFADLGVSSIQVDDPARGFSYKLDGPLDMRMNDRTKLSAADHLQRLSEAELSALLWELADEEDHAAIARAIVQRRDGSRIAGVSPASSIDVPPAGTAEGGRATRGMGVPPMGQAGVSPARPSPILRTLELSELIFKARGIDPAQYRRQAAQGEASTHPAAKTFQALRILVNNELASLRELLRVAPQCLLSGGRIGILTFHSGEDRLVKRAFAAGLHSGVYASIADEPLRPSQQEIYDNPRSRPAKFRWASKA
jgi:16S rRNA (cytosine1402-N4)-methyltransferase